LFTEQKQQLESCRQSVADLQTIRDELGGRVQQFQEKTSACEERMNELLKAHQVLYKDEVAVIEVLTAV
jgi:FtsZ-binding cell division protein ZapB